LAAKDLKIFAVLQTMSTLFEQAHVMQIKTGNRIIVAGQVLIAEKLDTQGQHILAMDRFGSQHELSVADITCVEATSCLLTRSEVPTYVDTTF
jgi:hypothetical protein